MRVKKSAFPVWRVLALAGMLLGIPCSTLFAQSLPAIPARLNTANCWPSGTAGNGTAQPLVAQDGSADSDVETFVQGHLDVSALPAGSYKVPVKVTDALGNESAAYLVDVVIFEPAWEPSKPAIDTDNDGLPDQWENQFFGNLNQNAEADSDNDGLKNLQELNLRSSPSDSLSPANRILRAEVFFDTDPGVGQALPLTALDGLLESDVEDVQIPGYLTRYLALGYHTVGIRVQRETGEWSPVRSLDLVVFEDRVPDAPEDFGIVEAEGFWEDLVTQGAGTELALASAVGGNDVRDISPSAAVGSTGQKPGMNPIYYRFKSKATGYGNPLYSLIQVQDPDPAAAEVPFYADSLFGVGGDFLGGTQLASKTFAERMAWWIQNGGLPIPMLGWIGTGDVTAFGTGNTANFTLTQGGTLTWLWGRANFAVTFQDDYDKGTGKGNLPRYQAVTSSVPQIIHLTPDTRLRCVGWTATGSAPASGIGNSTTYQLAGDTAIKWLWKKQHRVHIVTRHGEVDGWEEWYDEGTATALQPRPDEGYEFESWGEGLTGNATVGVATVSAPVTIAANFRPTQSVKLTVVQIDGSKTTTTHIKGETVDRSPTTAKIENGDTRDVATGWRSEGTIYDSGNGTNATLLLTRDTTLYWLPTRQYRLVPTIIPAGAGSVRIEGRQSTTDPDWYDAGPIRLMAKHATGNRFVDWYLQKWSEPEVKVYLSEEMPLVARFAKVEPLGDYVSVDGGALSSPNSALSVFRSFIPSAKMKKTEVTTSEYCVFLNWAVQAGYIEKPNHISVRGANPLAEYTEGLKAEWFQGEDWTAEPEFRSVVNSLSVDFGTGSPSQVDFGTPRCPFTLTDLFSFRLRGQIYSNRTGKISFKETCDDKVKIVFRGAVVLDNTDPNVSAAVQVDAFEGWNDVEFIFVESTNSAKFQIQWDPNGSTAWQTIPASELRHKKVSSTWASRISQYGVSNFYEDQELVDLDTVDCNIILDAGVYKPKSGLENHPLVDVTYYGADAYAQWLKNASGSPVTIPDEWLWEYAASGGNSTASGKYYPWGPQFLSVSRNNANYSGTGSGTDIFEGTSPIGIFPTYQGLQDMAGNVFEWTSTLYELSSTTDPFNILRGGSWNQPSSFLANSNRQVYKNQIYSDKASGFRTAIVQPVKFEMPGFLEVPISPIVATPNSTRADYSAPSERYLLGCSEVTNAEFVRFLNYAQNNGGLTIQNGWVTGGGVLWNSGKKLLQLLDQGPIQYVSGSFVASGGSQLQPVTSVTYFGADAYTKYLNQLDSSSFSELPSQWQWENAMLRSTTALEAGLVNDGLKNIGISKSGLLGTDIRYGLGFWPGFYDAVGNAQEWTSSNAANGIVDRKVVRGSAYNLDTPYLNLTKADQHYGLEEARPNLGFRVAVTRFAPKIEGLFDKVVLTTSGANRKLVYVANSFQKNPVWTFQKVSGPAWATMVDLGSGRLQVTLTPPAVTEENKAVFSISDGSMASIIEIPISVKAGGSYQITGLPNLIAFKQGESPKIFYAQANQIGSATSNVTWSIQGGDGNLTIEKIGDRTAKVTVGYTANSSQNATITATAGSASGSFDFQTVAQSLPLEFIDLQDKIVFNDNRLTLRLPLEIKGGSVAGTGNWNFNSQASSWARFIYQNGASAILEIDRAGFAANGTLNVTYSDGAAEVTRTLTLEEPSYVPKIILPASSFQFVAGGQPGRILVTAEDRNNAESLSWTINPSNSAVSLKIINARSIELVTNTVSPFSSQTFTVSVSDGKTSASAPLNIEVVNNAPSISGPTGVQEFNIDGTSHDMVFRLTDSDRGQSQSIIIQGPTANWFKWQYDEKLVARVSVSSDTPVEGNFTVTASDGISTSTRNVTVKLKLINGTPSVVGLPEKLNMAKYSAPVSLPFSLTDNDASDKLDIRLVFPIDGVSISKNGDRTGLLNIDPIQKEDGIPILLEVTDGKENVRSTIQLTIGSAAPDSHQIILAEYFVDVEPAPGSGVVIPSTNNEPFNDTATFARLTPVFSSLSVGWHKVGVRFKTVAGQWSAIQWLDFYVFDDSNRDTYTITRADGSLAYSRWWNQAPIGGQYSAPSWAGTFADLNPDVIAATNANLVFEDNEGIEQIDSAIVWTEYFIDNDPGVGNAAKLPMDRSQLDSTLNEISFQLDTSNLAPGLHDIGLRSRLADGTWGPLRKLSFYVFIDATPYAPPKFEIADAEYLWDGIGTEGFGIGLNLDNALKNTELGQITNQTVPTAPMDTGDHALSVRFKNQDNSWGEARKWAPLTIANEDAPLNRVNLHIESNLGVPVFNLDSKQLVGSEISLHVPILFSLNNVVYANFGYLGQGSAPSFGDTNTVSFTISAPSDITWIWGRDCEVVSKTDYGSVTGVSANWNWYPDYMTGFGTFAPLDVVALSVPVSVSVSTGTRQYCIGWQGTGSAPPTGLTNYVEFKAIAKSSEINWLWRKEHLVTVQVDGEGQVFGNEDWVADGKTLNLTAVPNAGHQFIRWESDVSGTNASTTLLVDAPKQVRAIFTKYKVWTVDPVKGSRILAGMYADGANVTVTTPQFIDAGVGSRFLVTGWSGAGSAKDGGVGRQASFVIHTDSEIRWSGIYQHWVDQRTNENPLGSINVSGQRTAQDGGWYDQGVVTIKANPSVGAVFARWASDLEGAPQEVNVELNGPIDAAAVFRSTINSPQMVAVNQGRILNSPNALLPSFPAEIPAFDALESEVTTALFADGLNKALAEKSIRVENGKVFGRKELPISQNGLSVCWYDATNKVVLQEAVGDLSTFSLNKTLSAPTAVKAIIQGEVYVEPEMSQLFGLKLSGSGSIEIGWNDQVGATNNALPRWEACPSNIGWAKLSITWNCPNANDAIGITISKSDGGMAKSFSGNILRQFNAEGRSPVKLLLGNIGSDIYEAYEFAEFIYNGKSILLDPALGNFWHTSYVGDFEMMASVSKPTSGTIGLMAREGLEQSSPAVSLGVNGEGYLYSNQTRVSSAPRDSWILRLSRRGAMLVTEFKDFDGKWKEAATFDLAISGIELFSKDAQTPCLAGLFTQNGNGVVSQLTLNDLSLSANREGQVLLDLAWPGANISYNGTFTPASGTASLPVVCVTLDGAQAFTHWVEERLQNGDYHIPSEWEAEFMSGGSKNRSYPWSSGANATDFANLAGGEYKFSSNSLAPVKTFSPSNGVYDLAGNAWEWTSSDQWPGHGFWKTIRGGSFRQPAESASAYYRLFYGRPDFVSSEVGFRFIKRPKSVAFFGRQIEGLDLSTLSLSSGIVRGFISPQGKYQISKTEVSNYDFCLFLNSLNANGQLSIINGWAVSTSETFNKNQKLFMISGNTGIVQTGSLFKPTSGREGQAVNNVTWYGADAFARWLTGNSNTYQFRLPTEWEWEDAAYSGYFGNKASVRPTEFSSQRGTGDAGSNGSPWGISGYVMKTAEWTSSKQNGDSNLFCLCGGSPNWFTGYSSVSGRAEFLAPDTTASHIGFRLVATPITGKSGTSLDGSVKMTLESETMPVGGKTKLIITRYGDPSFARTLSLNATANYINIPNSIAFAPNQTVVEVMLAPALDQMPTYKSDFSISAVENGTPLVNVMGSIIDQYAGLPIDQTIAPFEPINAKNFETAPFVVAVPTASSGLAVTLRVKSGPAIISVNNTVTLTGVGTVVVAANQAGDANYNSATEVTTSFSVAKGTPAISVVPSATVLTYGQALSNATLSGGSASVVGTFAFTSPATVPSAGTTSQAVTFSPTDSGNYTTASANVSVTVSKAAPVVTWNNPVAITYGTALSGTQLNASASVNGTFSYTPVIGSVLGAANQTLSVVFTPTDTANYNTVNRSVTLAVGKATPTISVVPTASGLTYGQALSNATLSGGNASVAGAFAFTSPATVPSAGTTSQTVTFSPTDSGNYTTASANVSVTVSKAAPVVTWNNPVAITYGTALSGTQLNASASVNGTFSYTPVIGSVLGAANQTLSVVFTPTDTANYNTVNRSVTLAVGKGTPTISVLPTASGLTYGQALSNATLSGGNASVAGTFAFTTPTTVPSVGATSQAVRFTPTDSGNYTTASANVSVTVSKAAPVVTWNAPASISYGTALSGTQLNASASVNGTFSYTPVSGTVLGAGNQTLSVVFTPTDAANYNTVNRSVTLAVGKGTPTINVVPTASGLTYGQTLSNATLSGGNASVAGAFAFATPTTVPSVGATSQAVRFTPTDSGNYTTVSANVSVTVSKAAPVVTWNAPASISYGTALSGTQLNASASVNGTFSYTPVIGSVLGAANQTLSVVFTPTDTANYNTVNRSVTLAVGKATPTISVVPTASGLTYGQALSNATLSGGNASVAGTFAFTTPTTVPSVGTTSQAVIFTPTDSGNYTTVSANVSVTVSKAAPVVTWNNPVSITYGTALSGTQLNASASVNGTFSYTPVSGAVLGAGNQTLSVVFTPTDAANYNTVNRSVTLAVGKGTPTISMLPTTSGLAYGQALSNATLSGGNASVAGAFAFATPTTVPSVGATSQAVIFTPTDSGNYTTVSANVSVTVSKAAPVVTWNNPVSITYGTALSGTQLNASASVNGTFSYTPVSGAVLGAGNQTLSVVFTPTDAANYNTVNRSVTLAVGKGTPTISVLPIASGLTYGQALSNATLSGGNASVAGAFAFATPTTVPGVGTTSQVVRFTPTDLVNYNAVSANVSLTVSKAAPVVTWNNPVSITYGTALSGTQLNASASVNGTFSYTPVSGAVLGAGNQTLSVVFTPTDVANYNTVNRSVTLAVGKGTPTISVLPTASGLAYGQTLSNATLSGGSASVAGTFEFTSPTIVPSVGTTSQAVRFTPTDSGNYTTASANVSVTVSKAAPVVTWNAPASISYGTALSGTQLNASASVNGTFSYTPVIGSVLGAANQTLSVVFTPTDTANYNTVNRSVTLAVGKGNQSIAGFTAIANKTYGDAPFVVATPAATSGLLVALSVKSGNATLSANNTVTFTGIGTVVLAANQLGNSNYNPAPEVSASFNVTRPLSNLTILSPALSDGSVTPGFAGITQREIGANYTVSAIPASGMLFKEWRKNNTLLSANATLSFAMEPNLTLTPVFVTDFAKLTGLYNGLVGTGDIGTGSVTEMDAFESKNGFIALSLLSSGLVSGNLSIEGQTSPLTGNFSSNKTISVSITRANKTAAIATLQLIAALSGEISGNVTMSGNTLPFRALRAAYTANGTAHALANRSYTVIIPPPDGVLAGHGFATFTTQGNGSALVTGRLATGDAISASAGFVDSGDGNWVLPIYSTGNSVLTGEMVIPKTLAAGAAEISGTMEWLRKPTVASNSLSSGFLKRSNISGAGYSIVTGSSLMSGNSTTANFTLTIDPQRALLPTAIAQKGTWPSNNTPGFVQPISSGLQMTFSSANGSVQGVFNRTINGAQVPTAFQGVMFGKPVSTGRGQPLLRGAGYFISGNKSVPVEITLP